MLKWAGIFGILLLTFGNESAVAELRCRVMDPTGTPLNVRALPGGNIISTLSNDTSVTVLSQTTYNGKGWVYIGSGKDDLPTGWVFQSYLNCPTSAF
jgi:hypothetical protein